MNRLQELQSKYGGIDYMDMPPRQKIGLMNGLKQVQGTEITSREQANLFLGLLRKLRMVIAEDDKLHGKNYPELLRSLLSVGEDGLYSNNLRFFFELIQNVDDCEYADPDDCRLDMKFDFAAGTITLTYNEVGFTPFNVYAITGTAEAAKNLSDDRDEIGEKGIGFKSVFGVVEKVCIRSGWFSFALYRDRYSIPVPDDGEHGYTPGTEMTLYIDTSVVPGGAKEIYRQIKSRFCSKEALFRQNPILFLNRLTQLRMYYDAFRSMSFSVERKQKDWEKQGVQRERIDITVKLLDWEECRETDESHSITCVRYTSDVCFSRAACQARYGNDTSVGQEKGKNMSIQVVVPIPEDLLSVGESGSLYSFFPTQIKLTAPIVCHVPFKLDASREYVDPQRNNLWFQTACEALSRALDRMYQDWCWEVGTEIIRYLPPRNRSIFEETSEKIRCLSTQQELFQGTRFLTLPVFQTAEGAYLPAPKVYYLDPAERVADALHAHKLLKSKKALFLLPAGVPMRNLGLEKCSNINHQIFRNAMRDAALTEEALRYLEQIGYQLRPEDLKQLFPLQWTPTQIETVMAHDWVAGPLHRELSRRVKEQTAIKLTVSSFQPLSPQKALYPEFVNSDAPQRVAEYLYRSDNQCLLLNIGQNCFLPCGNVLVLSAEDPVASFVEFCCAVDRHDTFSIRMQFRRASEQLNQWVEEKQSSPEEFLRRLRDIRLMVKESLGPRGYDSYLRLILNAGTDRNRFIQELLQNADDLQYDDDVIPTFTMNQAGARLVTFCNERGFSRSDIRAITAIGESTKNSLLQQDGNAVGNKGIGFKTVFAVASEVRIHSGEYHFRLSDQLPTIPQLIVEDESEQNPGTRMELSLKGTQTRIVEKTDLLPLCLCLRRLKRLQIDGHSITIEETESERIISIDKREYRFEKYEFPFTASAEAMEEMARERRRVSETQKIICYLPLGRKEAENPIYVKLPTAHRIKSPVIIDAPFELITSRERINTDYVKWNGLVRRKVYEAILQLMLLRRKKERADIFKLIRFVPRREGSVIVYRNDLFDCKYLNDYDVLSMIKNEELLPTFAPGIYARPGDKSVRIYPPVANYLFHQGKFDGISTKQVIDMDKAEYGNILNALACLEAEFQSVFPLLDRYTRTQMKDERFRSLLYEYLQNSPTEYQSRLRLLPVIPVFDISGSKTLYLPWEGNKIFVKKTAKKSSTEYYVLRESILPKSVCERFLGININEVTDEWEQNRYNENLANLLHGSDANEIYEYLLTEYLAGRLDENQSWKHLIYLKEMVPLRNLLGEVKNTDLFWYDLDPDYFPVEMLQRIMVHPECREMAKKLKYEELRSIHYENLDFYEDLTEEDVECLMDDYFLHSDELLSGCYRDGRISQELLEGNGLQYIAVIDSDSDETFSFPEEPAGNMQRIAAFIDRQMRDQERIISVQLSRQVDKIRNRSGETYDIPTADTRQSVLRRYEPEESRNLCYCQMCRKAKDKSKIEVNNLELKPEYYYRQMRIALCLECSVDFKILRQNRRIRQQYMDVIKTTPVGVRGTVDIPLLKDKTITFTGKHLAEIQALLRRKPKLLK